MVVVTLSDMLFAHGVLLVEGPTERVFLNFLAKEMGMDFALVGVSILEAGGLVLLPGLLRIVKAVVPTWRAVVDRDLLTDKNGRPADSRKPLGDILGTTIDRVTDEHVSAAIQRLELLGLSVMPRLGLEDFYCSKAAIDYRALNDKVSPKDKGWLLQRELEFILAMERTERSGHIRSRYPELLRPLEQLVDAVQRLSKAPGTFSDWMKDVLFSGAETLHKRVYREELGKKRAEELVQEIPALANGKLSFTSSMDYMVDFSFGSHGVAFRVRCSDHEFVIERRLRSEASFETLRMGTV